MRKENLITYSQADLIKEISEDYPSYSEDNIRNILESLEIHIKEHLAESELEHPVQVKIFFGLSLLGWIVPAASKNCFGVDVQLDDRIRVRPKLTRYFIRKINQICTSQQKLDTNLKFFYSKDWFSVQCYGCLDTSLFGWLECIRYSVIVKPACAPLRGFGLDNHSIPDI